MCRDGKIRYNRTWLRRVPYEWAINEILVEDALAQERNRGGKEVGVLNVESTLVENRPCQCTDVKEGMNRRCKVSQTTRARAVHVTLELTYFSLTISL